MYGKVFESIFDSTLVAEGGWLPTYIFMSMISIADKDGYVELAHKVLFTRLGFSGNNEKITYKDFEAALEFLKQVDTFSKSEDYNGRRIVPISELNDIEGGRGYWIVNYQKYTSMASREDRASQSTERSRRWRERNKKANKINNETQGDAGGRSGRHVDVDVDVDLDKRKTIDSTESLIPDDWWPNEKNIKRLKDQGLPDLFIKELVTDFRDYWVQAEEKKKKWDLVFVKNPVVNRKVKNYKFRTGREGRDNRARPDLKEFPKD